MTLNADLARAPFGSLLVEKQVLWAPAYEFTLQLLGSTGIILPFGDPNHEASDLTSFTTVGEEQAVFTYSEARDTWDNGLTYEGPNGGVPILTFNRVDEEADSPDADYWFRDDAGGANGFSIGGWVNIDGSTGSRTVLAKRGTNNQEWAMRVRNTTDIVEAALVYDSENVNILRPFATALTVGTWAFVMLTYDGAGGVGSEDTIHCYLNGVLDDGTANNDGTYTGMENLTSVIGLGKRSEGTQFFGGRMAGGPLGTCFTQIELTADQVLSKFQHDRALLGV